MTTQADTEVGGLGWVLNLLGRSLSFQHRTRFSNVPFTHIKRTDAMWLTSCICEYSEFKLDSSCFHMLSEGHIVTTKSLLKVSGVCHLQRKYSIISPAIKVVQTSRHPEAPRPISFRTLFHHVLQNRVLQSLWTRVYTCSSEASKDSEYLCL